MRRLATTEKPTETSKMPHMYLVSDTRERHVHGFIEALFERAGVARTVAQINTGDYLICCRLAGEQPKILASIERKTLEDFAASFKDGRYENRLKMLDLRDKTGCQLYFFVEGPAYPKPAWKVARIPYSNILSAMTNMMLRDGIHVVQTENELGTAQRLLDFVRGFEKTAIPYTYPLAMWEDNEVGDPPGGTEGIDPTDRGDAAKIPADGPPLMVMGAVEKSDDLLVVGVWARLTGISMPTAQVIASAFSVADLVTGRVLLEDLDALRTRGGRHLAKKGQTSLRALRRGMQKEEIKTLSGVPGISPEMATQILTTGGVGDTPVTLSTFLAYGPRAMAATTIQQKGRMVCLGGARAERIRRLMHYVGTAVNGAPEPVQLRPEDVLDDDEIDDLLGLFTPNTAIIDTSPCLKNGLEV